MKLGDGELDFGRTRRQICYHEAGHAVFQYRAGLKINYVCVPMGEGDVAAEWPCKPTPEQAMKLAASCVAAWFAEAKYLGVERQHMSFDDFYADADGERQFNEMLGTPPGRASDAAETLNMLEVAADHSQAVLPELYKEMCNEIDAGISEWWPEIKAVAEAVFEADNGYLDGEDTVQAIESVRAGSGGES